MVAVYGTGVFPTFQVIRVDKALPTLWSIFLLDLVSRLQLPQVIEYQRVRYIRHKSNGDAVEEDH